MNWQMYGTNSGHFVSEGENFRGEYVISRQNDCNNLTSCFRIGYLCYLRIFHRDVMKPTKISTTSSGTVYFSQKDS
uniref:Uncharacterized protein n=1 Tax=Salmonella enteritidis TaxID=149539 RepID=T1PY74_SALEN|nr:hypothetical protein pS1400_89_0017 [Salmonella enterica subsp. enterica serovar Enteritidis]